MKQSFGNVIKRAMKKETPTILSKNHPFLSSSAVSGCSAPSLTAQDINILFLLLEEPQQPYKEDHIHLVPTIHMKAMTEIKKQEEHKILLPRSPPACQQPQANFDRYQQQADPKTGKRTTILSTTTSVTLSESDKGGLPLGDENMCYEEHKRGDLSTHSNKRQRSPPSSPHPPQQDATPPPQSLKKILIDDAKDKMNCDKEDFSREIKRKRLQKETSHYVAGVDLKSNNKVEDEKILPAKGSSSVPAAVSTSTSSVDDREERKVNFTNSSSATTASGFQEDDDMKCLNSLFPTSVSDATTIQPPLLSNKEDQEQSETSVNHRIIVAEPSQAGDSSLTSSHRATPKVVDSWQAFMDKQQDNEDEKDQDHNEHQNMLPPAHGEALPAPTCLYTWQEPNSNSYSYHHQQTYDHQVQHYDPHPHHHRHYDGNSYFQDGGHIVPSHHAYKEVMKQDVSSSSIPNRTEDGSSTSYQQSSSSDLRNHAYSHHHQYRHSDDETSSTYPDNSNHIGHYYAPHRAHSTSRPRSNSSSRDHGGRNTPVHSYPPVPPLDEAHYLNDSGDLVYDSYYNVHHAVITSGPNKKAPQGQRKQQSVKHNRDRHGSNEIPSAYLHHDHYDPQQYYGRRHVQKSRTSAGSPSSLSSGMNISRKQQPSSEALQPYYNRQVLALSTGDDENWLSEFLCFVRSQCVEVFSASQDDVASRMNSKKVLLGQVGIRCRFCAHLPHRERTGRSSSFPSSINRIYQSLTMMLRDHFTKCSAMPPQMNERYLCLKANASQGATDSKKYWIESARTLGLVDTENEGMRFQHFMTKGGASAGPVAPVGGDLSSL